MSADFPSSNPFRRKGSATPASAPQSGPSNVNHIAYQQSDPQLGSLNLENIEVPKKITKKVRVQSPPPLSPSTPSLPDSASTIGEDNYSFSKRPPTPPIPRDDDPFDTTTSDTSGDEGLSKPNKAPANPFSRTLETMERPERDIAAIPPTNVSNPGRASLDVEAFKRLLMTGNSGVGTSTPPTASQVHVAHALGDGGSSTDASSVSRQSIFEAIQEPHPESPRTSHEISEPEDDRRRLTGELPSSSTGRKKPPPPSSRHGKLIRVELRDDATPNALQSPTGSITSQQYFNSSPRSQTDLNKPLPPAPNRASHESDRESIFDKEAAGKTPEPPSPSSSVQRKTAPAPPLTRRHSQKVPESKYNRNDTSRLSPKPEEDSLKTLSDENVRPRSDSGRAPPPPPSRRIGSVRGNSSQNLPLTSPSSVSLPSLPPARGSSRSISGRPPSVHSIDISSSNNKRASVIAPPPPPPRHGGTSFDGQSPATSRRTSGDYPRRSIDSARRGSVASSVLLQEQEAIANPSPSLGGHDILADLSKLQAEIDALRSREEREKEKDRIT